MKKFLLILLVLIVVIPLLFFSFLGVIPGTASLFGADRPRDLGTKYTAADLNSVRTKSQIQYQVLPDTGSFSKTRAFSGAREVKADFTAAEITASLNNQPWGDWPYRDLQVKFNADGSGEVSGVLLKEKLAGYAAAIGIPPVVVNLAVKVLPAKTAFYVKMKASLADNKVAVFEPQSLSVGRVPLPLPLLLSLGQPSLVTKASAQNFGEITGPLSKIENKKGLIIDYINQRLSSAFGSFYARSAAFGDNKLMFDGTLTESVAYTP
ncbi:MAG: hypothetical protein AAB486_03535 [Patescibacteria group bacterium]